MSKESNYSIERICCFYILFKLVNTKYRIYFALRFINSFCMTTRAISDFFLSADSVSAAFDRCCRWCTNQKHYLGFTSAIDRILNFVIGKTNRFHFNHGEKKLQKIHMQLRLTPSSDHQKHQKRSNAKYMKHHQFTLVIHANAKRRNPHSNHLVDIHHVWLIQTMKIFIETPKNRERSIQPDLWPSICL